MNDELVERCAYAIFREFRVRPNRAAQMARAIIPLVMEHDAKVADEHGDAWGPAMASPAELKPCPFCGGEAAHYYRPDTTGWSNTDWVCCTADDCGVCTPMEETRMAAVAVWNRRKGDDDER